jgi:hypothetical protein
MSFVFFYFLLDVKSHKCSKTVCILVDFTTVILSVFSTSNSISNFKHAV